LVLVLVGALCVTSFASFNHTKVIGSGTTNGPTTPQEGLSWWEFLQFVQFASYNSFHAALYFQGLEELGRLYELALAKGLDLSEVDELLETAITLVEEALVCYEKGDISCAGSKGIKAVWYFKEALNKLATLLGVTVKY